jgi:hypothetical protein
MLWPTANAARVWPFFANVQVPVLGRQIYQPRNSGQTASHRARSAAFPARLVYEWIVVPQRV